ncbi:FMN-binding protein [Kribbella sp. NPDC020789]
MRRGVVRTMSVVTVAVVGLSLRGTGQPADTPAAEPLPARRTTAPAVHAATPTSKPSASKPTPKPTPSKPAPSRTTAVAARSVNGDVVETAYGPVRVRITVQGGRITRARAVVHPQGDGTTDQINGYAVPVLDREVVSAQTARIDTVSGATYTSEGYRESLQSALDAAHQAGAL